MVTQSRSFVIGPADLSCHDAYLADAESAVMQGDVIEYRDRAHGSIGEATIFWGPYISLATGVYVFTFRGELDGELILDFSHSVGAVVMKEARLASFAEPVCVVLTNPVDEFEVRGRKTVRLKRLRLQEISVAHIAVSEGS